MIVNFKIYKINRDTRKLIQILILIIIIKKTRVLQFDTWYMISIANSESALRIFIPKFYFIV
jgi:hypothetical protein